MKGYTEMLKHDNGFLESWELIKIERLSFARMSPEIRFMFGLGVNALAVVNMNRMMDSMKEKATLEKLVQEPTTQASAVPQQTIPQPDMTFQPPATARKQRQSISRL